MRHKHDEWSISPGLRTAMLVIAVVIGVVVVVAWLAMRGRDDSDKSGQAGNEKNGVDELVLELRESDPVKTGNPAIKLDRIRRKIELAEKIFSLDPSEQDRQFAVTEKLSAMIAREGVNFQIGVANNIESTDLAGYSAGFRESGDNRILALASVGEAVASISQFLQYESSNAEQQRDLLQTAEDKIQAAASMAEDNLDIASTLFEWVQFARGKTGDEAGRQFAAALVSGFSGTKVDGIKKLLARLESSQYNSSGGLVDFLGAVPGQREPAIGQFVQQANDLLQNNDLDQMIVLGILKKASELLALGRTAAAASIHEQVAAHKSNSQESIRDQLKILKTRLNLFEQPLAVSAFRDFEGKPVDFAVASAKARLLFFISSATKDESLAKFAELIALFQSLLQVPTLEVVVVYLDDGQHQGDRADIETAASRTDQWKAWRLETQTEAGQQFLQNSALGSPPWLIILDRENKVVSMGTTSEVAEEVVLKKL